MISINDINANTVEGKYLLMAIAKITTESQLDKTPDEVLKQIKELATSVYTFELSEEECENISKNVSNIFFQNAIKRLQKELVKDKSEGSYYHSWQCSIAMAFKDSWSDVSPFPLDVDIHEIANNAAIRFLDQLIKE